MAIVNASNTGVVNGINSGRKVPLRAMNPASAIRPSVGPSALPPMGDSVVDAAIAAQQPLINASIEKTQAETDLIRSKADPTRRAQHRLRGGAIRSASYSNPLQTGTDLAAATRGSEEFQARVANDWDQRNAETASRIASTRSAVMDRRAAAPQVQKVAVVPGGTERTVSGPHGSGTGFVPSAKPVPLRSATKNVISPSQPKIRSQAAVTGTGVNPLFRRARI